MVFPDPIRKAPPVVDLAKVAEKAAETVAADVLAAAKADEHYAPLVAQLASGLLAALARGI